MTENRKIVILDSTPRLVPYCSVQKNDISPSTAASPPAHTVLESSWAPLLMGSVQSVNGLVKEATYPVFKLFWRGHDGWNLLQHSTEIDN